jgi:hypothetical protein
MVNQEELALCKRRSHTVDPSVRGWRQCTSCGMWVREKYVIEEREDEPPSEEIDPLEKMKRRVGPAEP